MTVYESLIDDHPRPSALEPSSCFGAFESQFALHPFKATWSITSHCDQTTLPKHQKFITLHQILCKSSESRLGFRDDLRTVQASLRLSHKLSCVVKWVGQKKNVPQKSNHDAMPMAQNKLITKLRNNFRITNCRRFGLATVFTLLCISAKSAGKPVT